MTFIYTYSATKVRITQAKNEWRKGKKATSNRIRVDIFHNNELCN